MKILIIGSVASGKTTLAKLLSKKLNISHYELDNVAHDKNCPKRSKRILSEQIKIIKEIDNSGKWICEGVFRESYKHIYDLAEVIIFLNVSLKLRIYRIISRFIKQKLSLEFCQYEPSIKILVLMFKWLKGFEENRIWFEKFLEPNKDKMIRFYKPPKRKCLHDLILRVESKSKESKSIFQESFLPYY